MRKLIATLITGVALSTAYATTVQFTYNEVALGDEYTYSAYGFSKLETYDVAMRITDLAYVGAKVSSMYVPVPAKAEWVKDVTGWLSTSLNLENKVNVPNICTVPATINDEQMLRVDFPEPYTITAEGVYIGYSLTVTQLQNYSTMPVAVLPGTDTEGLFVHTSRSLLKWTNVGTQYGYVSAMVVNLDVEAGDTDVAVVLDAAVYAVKDENAKANLSLTNFGNVPLKEIGYSWKAADASGSGTCTLTTAVAPGARGTASVEFGPFATSGDYPLELTVDTFNGEENNDLCKTANSTLVVVPFMPVNRPLVEEYTGLKCQFCPRGYVAMEQMTREHGDRFVGMAYHVSSYETGCMVTVKDKDFPYEVSGYPYGTINRAMGMDPSDFPAAWGEFAAKMVPVDLDVTLDYTDDTKEEVRAKVTARYARCFDDPNMKLSLAITAYGLENPDWGQQNYFSGSKDPELTGDLWDIFTQGPKVVYGLTFNDVVAYYKDTMGVEGSITGAVDYDSRPSIEFTVRIADIVNVRNQNFLTSGCSLRAVGMVLDSDTGVVINSNKSEALMPEISGVDVIEDGGAMVVAEQYYDLQGIRLSKPEPGKLVIVSQTLSDGSVRHVKKIIK